MIVGTGSTGNSTVVSATIPAAAPVGKTVLIVAYTALAAKAVSYPNGWVGNNLQSDTVGDYGYIHLLYKKIATGEPGTTVSFNLTALAYWSAVAVSLDDSSDIEPLPKLAWYRPAKPATPASKIIGLAGATTRYYKLTFTGPAGETIPSNTRTVTNAPAIISATDKVQLFLNMGSSDPGKTGLRLYASPDNVTFGLVASNDLKDLGTGNNNYLIGVEDTGVAPGAAPPSSWSGYKARWDTLDVSTTYGDYAGRLKTDYPARLLLILGWNAGAATPAAPTNLPVGTTEKVFVSNAVHASRRPCVWIGEISHTTGNIPSMHADLQNSGTGRNNVAVLAIERPSTSNGTPVPLISPDTSAKVGAWVDLEAGESYNLDGGPLTYAWVQTAGPTVATTDTTKSSIAFQQPSASVTFSCTVTGNGKSASASTTVTTVV